MAEVIGQHKPPLNPPLLISSTEASKKRTNQGEEKTGIEQAVDELKAQIRGISTLSFDM